MKKKITTKVPKLFSMQRVARAIAFTWLSACLITQAYAQNDKQISYPVAVPVERTSASSTPAAPVYKAPEPVIRAVEESSTLPAPTRKTTSTKKAVAEKPAKVVTEKKPATKQAAAKPAVTKKAVPTKPEPKATAKKTPVIAQKKTLATAPTIKVATPAAKNPESVTTNSLLLNSANAAEAIPAPVNNLAENNGASAHLKPAATALAVTALASENLGPDEEQQLANSLAEEGDLGGDYTEASEPVINSPLPSPVVIPASSAAANVPATVAVVVKNIPLPMAAAREAYIAEFKTFVETKLAPRVPGLAFAVIADGKVKVLEAYGVKKIGGTDPINTDTAFRLASVSKTIAGTAAGVLVSDGLINWDTPITSVLPNVEFSNPRYGNQLTLRNIMSQSTGLPTHSGDNFIEEGLPFDEVVGKLKAVNFVCPPGKCYSYQNVTLSLLGSIVQKKTGKTYEQYVKEKLFAPLGMRSASVGLEGLLATKNYALPHEVNGRGQWYTKEITQNYYRLNPAAGGNASITDMARWVLAQMGHNPDVLSPLTLQAIHAKVTKNTPAQSHYGARDGVTDTHYGMGWRTFDYRGDKNFLHHGGYVFGSRSEMVFNPELQIGMVILSNCNRLPGDIIFKFLDAYEDEKRGEKTIVPLPAAIKKKAVKK